MGDKTRLKHLSVRLI